MRREVSFWYFRVRLSGIDRETCQEAHCAIKWKFLKIKISRKLRKTKTFIFENFPECQLQNAWRGEFWLFLSAVIGDR